MKYRKRAGKTMAAQVLAHELGPDIYRINLGRVISNYIGETQKNLNRVFSITKDDKVMLFFNEVNALSAKHSKVGNAHDRFANIEVAYVLQRLEATSSSDIDSHLLGHQFELTGGDIHNVVLDATLIAARDGCYG